MRVLIIFSGIMVLLSVGTCLMQVVRRHDEAVHDFRYETGIDEDFYWLVIFLWFILIPLAGVNILSKIMMSHITVHYR